MQSIITKYKVTYRQDLLIKHIQELERPLKRLLVQNALLWWPGVGNDLSTAVRVLQRRIYISSTVCCQYVYLQLKPTICNKKYNFQVTEEFYKSLY